MNRQSNYSSYSFAAPATTRYSSQHSTSSAQSASANPDEDWTKISDLAERRRIQNRIAQRNYRKKLKRRLEDLERRAVSSSASPEQPHAEILPSQSRSREQDAAIKRRKNDAPAQRRPSRSPNFQHMSNPPMREDQASMFQRQYTRQLSASPPPAFAYSYSLPELPNHAPYPQHAPFHSLPAPYSDYAPNPSVYLPPLPVSLPSMSGYETAPSKGENGFGEEEMISHFNMSYSSMAGIEVPTTQSYTDPNAYVNHPEHPRYRSQIPSTIQGAARHPSIR